MLQQTLFIHQPNRFYISTVFRSTCLILLSQLVWSERLYFSQLQQRRLQGFPFLFTSLGAYLDTGDTVVFKYPIKIAPPFSVETKIGLISALDTQQNLLNHAHIRFCRNLIAFPLHTQCAQVNLWILSHNNNNPDPLFCMLQHRWR